MQHHVELEQRRLSAQVQARNVNLSHANEELMDQIRDLRESLQMREEANARRRRWYLSRMAHRFSEVPVNL